MPPWDYIIHMRLFSVRSRFYKLRFLVLLILQTLLVLLIPHYLAYLNHNELLRAIPPLVYARTPACDVWPEPPILWERLSEPPANVWRRLRWSPICCWVIQKWPSQSLRECVVFQSLDQRNNVTSREVAVVAADMATLVIVMVMVIATTTITAHWESVFCVGLVLVIIDPTIAAREAGASLVVTAIGPDMWTRALVMRWTVGADQFIKYRSNVCLEMWQHAASCGGL